MKPTQKIPDPKNNRAFELVKTGVERFWSGNPLVIGITGAGGAGKTTFGENIEQYYGSKNCVSIDLDDYLISREKRGKMGLTGYNPRANKLAEAQKAIENLKSWKTITKPRYDHKTGKNLEDEEISPRNLIIIEGVTTLYRELRELNDISFFLDALEETQIQSRIQRDVKKRGYTFEEAMVLLKNTKPDYKRFIEPTKEFAKVIFQVGTDYIMMPTHIDKSIK